MANTMTDYEYNPTEINDREDFITAAKKDPYDSAWSFGCDPREVFDFEVVGKDSDLTWSESYIGTNLGCVTDYGRHWDLSDKQLIEKVVEKWKGALTPQFLGFMDSENKKVAEKVVIVRKESGYTKTAPVE